MNRVGADGGDRIGIAWRDALRPEPYLTVSEWADRHRFLAQRASAEPGRYRTARAPYLREIMDALSPHDPAQRVVFMKAAQVGATEAGNNWIGYVIHHAPAPMLAVQPTLQMAERNSKQRIAPLIDESPALRTLIPPARSRDSGNTLLSKDFPGGVLILTGANSAAGLRSMPARFVFLDEVDGYPNSADEEGDPVGLAEARTQTFGHRRKVFLVSTPTIKGASRIEREFEASDQRRYHVPCPHCGHMQWLRWERLRWDKGDPDSARYWCEECETPIGEGAKAEMLAGGEWRATAEAEDPKTVGFHISALYSPPGWTGWAQLAREWLSASASDESRRVFVNTKLGETWQETGDAPDWQRLAERREAWSPSVVPEGALFLTAGVDVQKDRLEADVWGWGPGLESWLIDHVVMDGGPEDPATWRGLTELLDRTWPHALGGRIGLTRTGLDSGYETMAVYGWARDERSRVAVVKGEDGFNRAAPVSGPTRVDVQVNGKRLRRGMLLWTVATATLKAETYRFLRLPAPTEDGEATPAGFVHLPKWADAEWMRQLTAEHLVTVRTRRGGRLEWRKMRERNEALDCRVYARAAAWIAGIDRWGEDRWDALRRDLDVAPEPAPVRRARRGGARSDWIEPNEDWLK